MNDLVDTSLFRGRDNCCRGGQPQGVLGRTEMPPCGTRDKQTRRELSIPAFFLVCRPIFMTLFINPLLPSSDQARAEPNGLSALLATKIFLVVHILNHAWVRIQWSYAQLRHRLCRVGAWTETPEGTQGGGGDQDIDQGVVHQDTGPG